MKKVFLMAVAMTAVLFASCSKEDTGSVKSGENTQLMIKIAGVVKSKAIEDPGTAVATTLSNGHIFIVDAAGAVIHNEALVIATATGAGQLLGTQVPGASRVFIVGNIPTGQEAAIAALTTMDAIKAATSAMTTQADYLKAALANATGEPAVITVTSATTASVSVALKPLISRIELTQVKGGADIVSFKVTGVYVDNYGANFTYGGGFTDLFSQGVLTTFAGIGDAGDWVADANKIAKPDVTKVWAHNVASGGLPRFIIRLEELVYDNLGVATPVNETRYLTVTGYTGIASFDRGKIYRIGAENGITFTFDNTGTTPNPQDVDLRVNVSVLEWVIETPDAIL